MRTNKPTNTASIISSCSVKFISAWQPHGILTSNHFLSTEFDLAIFGCLFFLCILLSKRLLRRLSVRWRFYEQPLVRASDPWSRSWRLRTFRLEDVNVLIPQGKISSGKSQREMWICRGKRDFGKKGPGQRKCTSEVGRMLVVFMWDILLSLGLWLWHSLCNRKCLFIVWCMSSLFKPREQMSIDVKRWIQPSLSHSNLPFIG